jgi:acetyl-CoA acetyltransferase
MYLTLCLSRQPTIGNFLNEIVPVSIPQRRGDPIIFDKDEFPRAGVTPEAMMKVRAAFKKGGSVSAANASGLNDGAAAVMVTSEEYALENGLKPLARIVSYASAGERMRNRCVHDMHRCIYLSIYLDVLLYIYVCFVCN